MIEQKKISETYNLASLLNLKISARVILTVNINIKYRLVHRLLGRVMEFGCKIHEGNVIHVKFDDENAGLVAMHKDFYARQ